MYPPLVVLIAVAGKKTRLHETLDSLSRCRKPDSFREVIIVENGTKYNAEDIVSSFKDRLMLRYLYFNQGNKSAALNFAISQIPDDFLIFFSDDDITYDEQILMSYFEASKNTKTNIFFGGSMSVNYEKDPPQWLKEALPASAKGWKPTNNEYMDTPRFLGCNWAAFAGDIKKTGGFNTNLGPGTNPRRTGQEWEMQERLLQKKFEAKFVDNARVFHYVPKKRSSLKWLIRRRYQGGLSTGYLFLEKHGKAVFPSILIKTFLKVFILSFVYLPTLSKKKWVISLSELSKAYGGVVGYIMKYLSMKGN